MSVINVLIGRSRYQIDCLEGEEDKIDLLAARLNDRVNQLSSSIKNADEKTILMLCALTMEEELESNKNPETRSAAAYQADLQNAVSSEVKNVTSQLQDLIHKVKAL